MTQTFTTEWPDIVDVLVRPAQGLWVANVQTPDERSLREVALDARSKRAALIETTAWLAGEGYLPTHRWDTDDDEADDALRRFRTTARQTAS